VKVDNWNHHYEFTIMPHKKNDIELIWFEHLKNKEWLPPEYLKYIQKFETSLILLSVNKNADAVIKIVESLEGISRQRDGMINNYDYKWTIKARKISDEIYKLAIKINKKRNKWIHKGYAPTHSQEAFELFFTHGLQILSALLEDITKKNLFDLVDEGSSLKYLRKTSQLVEINLKKFDECHQQNISLLTSAIKYSIETTSKLNVIMRQELDDNILDIIDRKNASSMKFEDELLSYCLVCDERLICDATVDPETQYSILFREVICFSCGFYCDSKHSPLFSRVFGGEILKLSDYENEKNLLTDFGIFKH
jgi:hypothetical protein